jgi:RecA/RadA recombinase
MADPPVNREILEGMGVQPYTWPQVRVELEARGLPTGPERDEVPARDSRTSWAPVDLGPVLAGDELEPPPAMLHRADEAGLLYAGKVHSFAGEPESGKSWLALAACVEAIEAGQHVAYLDFEDQASGIVGRLRNLGATDEAIHDRFGYLRPDEPLTQAGRADLEGALASSPSLAVVDGVTEAMTLLGLDVLNNRDVARFIEEIPRRLTRSGAAVILIDHVVKAKGERGRYAIGAQHKLAGIDGAGYSFEILRPFGRGLEGVARIWVTKDRPGFVRQSAAGGKVAGEFHLRSEGDAVVVEIRPAEFSHDGAGLSPSRRWVLDALPSDPASSLTVQQIGDRVAEAGHPLKRATIQKSLTELLEEGCADADKPGTGLPNRWWRT